jgi:dipeptidyl-peptidase-4
MLRRARLLVALALCPLALAAVAGCRRRAPATAARRARAPGAAEPARRADTAFLARYASTYRFSLGQPAGFQFTPSGETLLFLRSASQSFVRDLLAWDTATGEERVLLTAEQLLRGTAEQLSPEERARRERLRLTARGIAGFQLSRDGAQILVPLSGRLFLVQRASGAVRELPALPGPAEEARLSPDGARVAAVHAGDLYVLDLGAPAPDGTAPGASWQRLTTRSGPRITHGVAEFVAQEEMDRMEGYWWSPDSRALAYQETDESAVEQLSVFDPTHPEREAELHAYPRAGHANAAVRLGVVPVEGGATSWVAWDRERYPYLARVVWSQGAPLTLLVQNREQTEEVLLAAAPDGTTRTLLTEADAVWLNLDPAMPRWLADGSGFLWSTERAGRWQLELRGRDGAQVRTLTPPEANYRALVALDDEDARAVWFTGGAESSETHVFRVALAGGAPEQLTHGQGEFAALRARRGGSYLLVESSLRAPTRFVVHRRDGGTVGEVRSLAEDPGVVPRVELVTVGARGYRAAIVRPRAFDPRRRYPVIVSVYGGPHARTVTARRDAYLLDQWFADQGFVVVAADGRGTPARGRAWERALRGAVGEVPLADQVEALQALLVREPAMDPARVGIFGWSYGGYMAAFALLHRPDVFRAGVAGAPVTDWRDYDTHYTERYLGLPAREAAAYDRASLVAHAGELRGALLLIHGTADDNVYFGHSVRFSDALFRAGRDHRFLPLTGFTHMVPDPNVASRLYGTIAEHFLTNL